MSKALATPDHNTVQELLASFMVRVKVRLPSSPCKGPKGKATVSLFGIPPLKKVFHFFYFVTFSCICMCAGAPVEVRDHLQGSVFSFHQVGSRD